METPELQPCTFVPRKTIDETLASPASSGKHLLEPLKTFAREQGLPFNVLEDMNVSNEAEVHRHEGDLWMCLEGEVTFVYGGKMVAPWAKKLADLPAGQAGGGVDDREIKAKEIVDGTESVMKPGDWLWIPAGQPHLHKTDGLARLVIIKIPAKEIVPLDSVPGWKN